MKRMCNDYANGIWLISRLRGQKIRQNLILTPHRDDVIADKIGCKFKTVHPSSISFCSMTDNMLQIVYAQFRANRTILGFQREFDFNSEWRQFRIFDVDKVMTSFSTWTDQNRQVCKYKGIEHENTFQMTPWSYKYDYFHGRYGIFPYLYP